MTEIFPNTEKKNSISVFPSQRAAGGCEAVKTADRIPFGVARRNPAQQAVGRDGEGPVQPADLSGSLEAALRQTEVVPRV